MIKIDLSTAVNMSFDSLLADRLALLCGAGLSMAPPSSIPSAFAMAKAAKAKYDATYGGSRPPLPSSIDDQAEFFFKAGNLETYYLTTLVDHDAFASKINAGHSATADMLLTRGIVTAVSTNVDQLIEFAGHDLYGAIDRATSVQELAAVPTDRSPLLKVHGCWSRPSETIWAVSQVKTGPAQKRVADCALWLTNHLLNRDLLIVGFWTDWDYLNDVLGQSVASVTPGRVMVIDPSGTADLEAKAPGLFKLGQKAKEFVHLQESGAIFLDRLRVEFSRSFVRRVLSSGAADYASLKGIAPDNGWLEAYSDSSDALWRIRRDLEGAKPNAPSRLKEPPAGETLVGLTLLLLRSQGAISDDSCWLLNGKRIRVLRTPNVALHAAEADYSRDTAPLVAPDRVVAVGAEDISLRASIARGSGTGSIARGASTQWLTHGQAVAEFSL